jgi:hypothetical protein
MGQGPHGSHPWPAAPLEEGGFQVKGSPVRRFGKGQGGVPTRTWTPPLGLERGEEFG